jgi:hypothetical protein
MSSEQSILGTCPACYTEIPTGMLLIEYEKDDHRAVYAECPLCEDPVHPR